MYLGLEVCLSVRCGERRMWFITTYVFALASKVQIIEAPTCSRDDTTCALKLNSVEHCTGAPRREN